MHCKYTIEVSLCLIIISLMNNKCTCGSIKRRHCKTHRENAPAFQLKNPCKCSSCRVQIILYAGSHFAPSLQSTVLFYVALHILALGYVSHISTSILFTKYIIYSAFFLFFLAQQCYIIAASWIHFSCSGFNLQLFIFQ